MVKQKGGIIPAFLIYMCNEFNFVFVMIHNKVMHLS